MFKSIFTKYMVTFAILIGIGFAVITLIMSSMITNYSIDTKDNLMYQTAELTYTSINGLMMDLGISYRDTLEYYPSFLENSIEHLAAFSESVIILIDEKGEILLKSGNGSNIISDTFIPEAVLENIEATNNSYRYSDLGGLFPRKYLNYFYTLTSSNKEGNIIGAIIISSPSTGVTGMVEKMTKTIIISSIWVFIAALVAVYFLSQRIIEPIKDMSKAAKSFSKGDFDVQIPVVGTDEVAELANAFNNMATSLKELEDSRRLFIGNVSHDLRTPMTSIGGFIDGIRDGTIPPEKQNYYLDIVSVETKRLSRLVNSLLDITRIEQGDKKQTKTVFDICELARLIIISFEEKIESKNLNIEFECEDDPSMVIADKDAIHQVLYNLCHNAIKFVNDSGDLKISITKKEKKYLVSVYNTGTGIEEKDIPYIFDRFYKADPSRGLDKSGAGLGLYIVKTIIDNSGESIKINSKHGSYCEFVFTLTPAGKKPTAESIKSKE